MSKWFIPEADTQDRRCNGDKPPFQEGPHGPRVFLLRKLVAKRSPIGCRLPSNRRASVKNFRPRRCEVPAFIRSEHGQYRPVTSPLRKVRSSIPRVALQAALILRDGSPSNGLGTHPGPSDALPHSRGTCRSKHSHPSTYRSPFRDRPEPNRTGDANPDLPFGHGSKTREASRTGLADCHRLDPSAPWQQRWRPTAALTGHAASGRYVDFGHVRGEDCVGVRPRFLTGGRTL